MGTLSNWRRLVVLLGWLIAAVPTVPGAAVAQGVSDGGPIEEIRIEGSQRIEPETVRSYMQIDPGDTFAADLIDRALKNLFATGLYADVNFGREANTLVVLVVENPIINRLAFERNNHIDDDTLAAEVQLRARVVFTQAKVQSDAKRILELYRRSGRFAATVEPKVIKLEQNRVDLVFEIDEGPVTGVTRVDFVGNVAFSDSDLRGEIITQESAWYRFLTANDRYDPDRLTVDRELLRNFYLKEGYADFRVLSAVAELSPDRSGFFITVTVDEGERYHFGKIDVDVNIKGLDPAVMWEEISTIEGDWYDASAIEKSISGVVVAVGTLGYAFVEVDPRMERDAENKIVNLTYVVREGPKVFVDRIDIVNNVRTLDKVIRREFRLVEGDPFNTQKEKRTQQRIQNLGFFSKVDIKTIPSDQPDRTIIVVEVEEKATGEITFGLGFSTSEGPLGNISIRERNLLGKGQDARLDFTLSGIKSQLLFSFTEPYFLDKDISAGFDVYRNSTSNNASSYEEAKIGGGVRAGYDLTEYLRHSLRYNLTYSDVTGVDASASQAIKDLAGTHLTSMVGQDLTYDRRDSRFDPRDGYFIRLRQDLAGLGGDVRYLSSRLGGGYYVPFGEEWSLGVSGELGYINGLGHEVRTNDSFFVGSTNLRGFTSGGIGPRDTATNDALGGKQFAVGSVELGFPLPIPDEYQMRGRFFTDVGTLYDTDATVVTDTIVDQMAVRAAIGAGITWVSPFGPLQVDLAYPVLKESYDETEWFRFNVGSSF